MKSFASFTGLYVIASAIGVVLCAPAADAAANGKKFEVRGV